MTQETPLVVLIEEGRWRDYAGRADVLVIVVTDERVELPQFDIEVAIEGAGEVAKDAAVEQALRQMLAVYRFLSELPPHFINEVERGQIEVIEEAVAPWLMRHLARNPSSFHMPPLTSDLVGA